jgi:nitrite reductase/ring-hydroxylating ferredoxin subunit
MLAAKRSPALSRAGTARRAPLAVVAAFTATGATLADVEAAGGKKVVEVGAAGRVLLAQDGGKLYALANKCAHLGLPLQGKTPLLQAKIEGGCVTCPAHGTKFALADGAVQGEWCPKMPSLGPFGKLGNPKPQPTFPVRVTESGAIEVDL